MIIMYYMIRLIIFVMYKQIYLYVQKQEWCLVLMMGLVQDVFGIDHVICINIKKKCTPNKY